jgi:thiol-disulfide isomerase/thioredoxin
MTSFRRRFAAVACAALTLLSLGACSGATSGGPSTSDQGFVSGDGTLTVLPVDQRAEAPTLIGEKLGGGTFDLADLRGDVVVLNVWGSWCGPCRKEAPELQAVSDALKTDDVKFIGLNTRDKPEPAQAFIDRFKITYPTVLDPDGKLQLAFSDTLPPAAIPSTLIIDREGRVAARIIGPLESSTVLRQLAEQVVDEKASS